MYKLNQEILMTSLSIKQKFNEQQYKSNFLLLFKLASRALYYRSLRARYFKN